MKRYIIEYPLGHTCLGIGRVWTKNEKVAARLLEILTAASPSEAAVVLSLIELLLGWTVRTLKGGRK